VSDTDTPLVDSLRPSSDGGDPDAFPVPAIAEPEPPTRKSLAGRIGRKPKAKSKAKPATEAQAKQRANASQTAKRKRVEAEARTVLVKWRSEFGTLALTRAPVVGVYVLRTDDEVIDAAVRLAGKNARLLEGLAASGDLLAVLVLARWAGGLAVAFGVETGRVDPASTIATAMGLDKVIADLEREGLVTVVGPEGVASADEHDQGTDEARADVTPAGVAVL
jgi:hypothetical protein